MDLKVNGTVYQIKTDANTPLLYVLRNELQLKGPKYGCGLEQCGACMVHLNGQCAPSCKRPISELSNIEIRTIEDVAISDTELHPLQKAFIDEQAAQCGYCTNGLIMHSLELLQQNPNPTESEIKEHLARNICRCGVHSRVVRAVLRAAKTMQ